MAGSPPGARSVGHHDPRSGEGRGRNGSRLDLDRRAHPLRSDRGPLPAGVTRVAAAGRGLTSGDLAAGDTGCRSRERAPVTSRVREGFPSAWRRLALEEWAVQLGVTVLEIHAVLPSTNDRVRRLALEGAPSFTTVVAEAQTKGRGRGGRSWHSPAGSGLWISVLLPSGSDGTAGPLSLAVGLAAARAVEHVSGIPVQLKWPNDVLHSGLKVAGILCETGGEGGRQVVAGIGINIRRAGADFPPELEPGMAFVEEMAGREVSEAELAEALLGELRSWARSAPRGVTGELRAEWEARDCLRGRRVAVEGGDSGVCRGVRADGALEIASPDGTLIAVRTGSVRVIEPGPSPALHRASSGAERESAGTVDGRAG
ncbi:MAG: biotin--[acetyl-CoA-carboxylase] ligase [Gemmatimonadetes bacterium]|nr:biotin--[acetyl-CoA-carboxylase] ligase [Gemmatimonadota bacterium]